MTVATLTPNYTEAEFEEWYGEDAAQFWLEAPIDLKTGRLATMLLDARASEAAGARFASGLCNICLNSLPAACAIFACMARKRLVQYLPEWPASGLCNICLNGPQAACAIFA